MKNESFLDELNQKLADIQKKYECQNIVQLVNCTLGYGKTRGFITLREWRTFLNEFCDIPTSDPLNCPDGVGFLDPDSLLLTDAQNLLPLRNEEDAK